LKCGYGFTRKIELVRVGGILALVKHYRNSIRHLIVDFSKNIFSLMLLKPRISFLSAKERVLREILGHRRLEEAGIQVPKIIDFSLRDSCIVEELVEGIDLHTLVVRAPNDEAEHFSMQAGEITGLLHSKGFAFLDNRPQNYLVSGGRLVRVDLETFEKNPSRFERYCDVVSFTESFKGEIGKRIREAFIRGYEKYAKHVPNWFADNLAGKALTFFSANSTPWKYSLSNENPVGLHGSPLMASKHLLTSHFGFSKGD
jgi:tRNA A-37 threonylcarbamoyl transferase component Bud32